MQPKTQIKFDRNTFQNVKRTIQNMSMASRAQKADPTFALDIPDDIGIKLNNGCNLRCKHCFEWANDGFHHDMDKETKNQEIDFSLLESILEQTRARKSRLFIWGGEPLFYSKFEEFADLLARDPRNTTICTNALLIEKHLDSILRISKDMTLLISLDGFETENDAIRGKGTFQKVIHVVNMLLELQRTGEYQGRISIGLTISDSMVTKLYDFMEYFENLGVDTVYFVFPWYIPTNIAEKMDHYFEDRFPWLEAVEQHQRYSWHSFSFRVSPENIEPLISEIKRVNDRVWQNRIRFQPALELDEVKDFVLGSEKPAMKREQCLSIANRLDVMPDGKVNPCKFFPEFTLGDLNGAELKDVFQNDNFRKHREILGEGLTPICSRCVLLYNYGR
ncbi:radical SAM protein [Paenibacillus sp. SYP-B3998]|uniref:Radical SAM protein n=1 Tax=Paenibacillus sp. SYP-B3998 TaxID=2678564 RepID=A0A6G3ZW86_9BACL|nr:radical SAM protein [Paenibacillus sp. SYP-B3998]NEW06392.1 radical SAM protein [Paenibacillus sp. SYP-B3998]